jgi:hypothetical protein
VTSRARAVATACAGLLAAAVAFAWRDFLTGRRSPFEKDIEFYHHPITQELVRGWSEGRVPLWTDAIYCGFPVFADSQAAAWYPGTLLVAALGPHAGYAAFLLLHALLAAVGALALVRAHAGGWPAALAAGLVVPLSGFYAYETQHPGLFAILCWVPAQLACTRAVLVRPTGRRVALAALPPALIVFAGTLQVLFGVILLYGLYLAGATWDVWRARGARAALRGASAAVAAQLLGLALAAVVVVPTFAHFPHTGRALGMTYEFASLGSLPPVQLLGVFVNGAAEQLGRAYQLDFEGASFHAGALTLPLALVGALLARRRLRIGVAAAAILLGLLALGRHGVLHRELYDLLPGAVGALRGVGRALGPLVVCLALLAGLGVQRLSDPGARRLLAVLLAVALGAHALVIGAGRGPVHADTAGSAGVVAAALLAGFACRRRPRALQTVLVALMAVDLLAFGAVHDWVRRGPPPPGARQLAGALRFPALADVASGRFGDVDGRVLVLGFGVANFVVHHRLEGVGGYNPLVTLQYLDFVSLVNEGRVFPRAPLAGFVHDDTPERLDAPLFEAASARFVLSDRRLASDGLRLLARYSREPISPEPAYLYRNERALPRAYLAYRTRRADGPEALARLTGDGFDPRREAVFEGDVRALDGSDPITPLRPLRSRPEEVAFDISPERPALLVLADAWYPGWRARVDGSPAPVVRVNGHFRGVPVPVGARRVELVFAPATWRAGAAISLAAAAVVTALTVGACFRRRSGLLRSGAGNAAPVPRAGLRIW